MIADDPKQWSTTVPKGWDSIDTSVEQKHNLFDYHILRDTLHYVLKHSTDMFIRAQCRRMLNDTPKDGNEV